LSDFLSWLSFDGPLDHPIESTGLEVILSFVFWWSPKDNFFFALIQGPLEKSLASQPSNIAASAVSGIRWNYIGGICASLCSVAIGIVLARILGPRPFGQVIIASTVYGFLNLFVDGGFSQALIQKLQLDHDEIRKTFTCQVGIGIFSTAFVYVLAPWIAMEFHDPSATRVIQAMSMVIAIQSIGLVSAALLRRGMQFKRIQHAALASYLFGFLLVGIPLAIYGAGVWSLVLAYLLQCTLNSALLYLAARHSVAPLFAFPDRSTMSFGGTIIANNLANWGHSNLDNIAASHLGPSALGLYGRGCNFAYQPVNTVVTGLQSVLLSATAKVQGNKPLMRDLTLAVIAIVFGILGAAYATFAMNSATTIVGLYGNKWVGVIPLMIPFAIAMPLFGVHCLLGPILCGMGRPALEFWPQAITCALAVLAYFTAAHFSLVSIAWALLFIMILRFGMIAAFTFRLLKISWADVTLLLLKRTGFSVIFGGINWCADQTLRAFHLGAGYRLGILLFLSVAMLGLSVWSASHIVFGRQAVRFMLGYASHLPQGYVKRLRLQVKPGLSPVLTHS
jgi:lipopolysaccharide exporter